MKELAQSLGIPFLELDDYEADDIIGTLATQAAEGGTETVVVTGDRDDCRESFSITHSRG